MSDKPNTNQLAIEILKLTNDGDDLIPCHLKLLENAVNGFLDEKGLQSFKKLLETVRAGYKETRTKAIAKLNDELRTTFNASAGQVVGTHGIASLSDADRTKIFSLVMHFNSFTEENDPYGEHDMGSVKYNNHKVFWKIDCYDNDLHYGSEDPADPEVTKRVLTVMLAHEY